MAFRFKRKFMHPYLAFEVDMGKEDSSSQTIYTIEIIRRTFIPVGKTNIIFIVNKKLMLKCIFL